MDVASLLTLLLLALALAVQPWSVLAAVLLVTSDRGVAKAVAFAAGWVLALTVVAIDVVALYPATPKVTSSSPWVSWVQLGSGAALGAWLYVRKRAPDLPEPESQPRWMTRLDSMSPWPAFLLGAFLPNYVIVVAAVGDVLQTGLTQVWTAAVLLLFIIVASAGVAIPLLVLVFRREEAPAIYARWRTWLVAHGQALVRVVLTVVAVVLMTKGVFGLLS
jgi:threonine/homoserine/homoserine lactone efflux protein